MSADLLQSPAGATILHLAISGTSRRLELVPTAREGCYKALLDGRTVEVDAQLIQPGVLSLILDGCAYRCVLDEAPAETALLVGGKRFPFQVEDPRSLRSRRGKQGVDAGRQIVKAPMPGRIVRVLVAEGDPVAAHQGVIVVEAMKMQNELKAVRGGTVIEIRTQPGDTVTAGQTLLVIE